jgi:hypothetical protein
MSLMSYRVTVPDYLDGHVRALSYGSARALPGLCLLFLIPEFHSLFYRQIILSKPNCDERRMDEAEDYSSLRTDWLTDSLDWLWPHLFDLWLHFWVLGSGSKRYRYRPHRRVSLMAD